MAKLFRTNSRNHPVCYALQRSEDVMIAGAYIALQATGEKCARLLKTLGEHWLLGSSLSDCTLIWLNDTFRSQGVSALALVDGHSTTYSLCGVNRRPDCAPRS